MRWLSRLFLLVVLAFAVPASGQSILERLVSPGPLSAPHAKLEANCNSCHESFSKASQNGKCLACHKDIASDVRAGSGYHGKYGNARTWSCKACHSDHKGRGFGLIRFTTTGFNHAYTDYPLEGGHAKAACASCHKGQNYKGTATACASCHAAKDPHKGQLGKVCQTCHQVAGWKTIKPFDHGRTGFALTGAHARAACLTCHAGQRWQGLPQTCLSCHAKDDAHKGTRGTNCSNCHSTGSWRATTFNHNSDTAFPLVGQHGTTACAACHGANNAIRKPARDCVACHRKDDTHKGENGTNCASCHTARDWKQTNFDHDRMTRFPLNGAHDKAACAACHKQPAKLVKPPVTCFGCHAADDSHKGANGMDCARCHTSTSWKQTSFNHNSMTRFPLKGAHGKLLCAQCHVPTSGQAKPALDCVGCHAKDDVHKGNLGKACASCHSSDSWRTGVVFDHELTRFPLMGKHRALTCQQCHADKGFVAKGLTCQSCHVDDHHKGVLGKPAACATCHSSTDWKLWRFDHDAQTTFPLTGKHQGLICSACHVRAGNPSAISQECASCHKRDDIHHGGFGVDCQRCHTTVSFSEIKMKF